MFSIRVYLAVAAAVALAAFGVGQIAPGLGVAFAVLVSTLWAAYCARRHRRLG
jgi:hypothetical protein